MTEIVLDTEPLGVSDDTLIKFARPEDADATLKTILERGSIPLLVGDSILAEISNDELSAGLEAANEMSDTDIAVLSRQLADGLRGSIDAGHSSGDLYEIAADAAALFVLCLRRNGVISREGVEPCSVCYDPANREIKLDLSA